RAPFHELSSIRARAERRALPHATEPLPPVCTTFFGVLSALSLPGGLRIARSVAGMKLDIISRFLRGLCGTSAILVLGVASRGASAAGLDRNNNGLNDAWEMLFQGSSLAPSEDSDGDGFSNLAESLAGTNPLDPNSFPALQIDYGEDGESHLSWNRIPGKHY